MVLNTNTGAVLVYTNKKGENIFLKPGEEYNEEKQAKKKGDK